MYLFFADTQFPHLRTLSYRSNFRGPEEKDTRFLSSILQGATKTLTHLRDTFRFHPQILIAPRSTTLLSHLYVSHRLVYVDLRWSYKQTEDTLASWPHTVLETLSQIPLLRTLVLDFEYDLLPNLFTEWLTSHVSDGTSIDTTCIPTATRSFFPSLRSLHLKRYGEWNDAEAGSSPIIVAKTSIVQTEAGDELLFHPLCDFHLPQQCDSPLSSPFSSYTFPTSTSSTTPFAHIDTVYFILEEHSKYRCHTRHSLCVAADSPYLLQWCVTRGILLELFKHSHLDPSVYLPLVTFSSTCPYPSCICTL